MMKAFAVCIAVSVLWSGSAFAQTADKQSPAPSPAPSAIGLKRAPDTMMFTIDELNEIQSHLVGAASDSGKSDAIENASLYLSTIVYVGPKEWTIWVNGIPIGPKDEFQSLKVTDISPGSVELLVPLSAQGMRPVRLGPNQTFLARSGVVVEGQVK